MKQPIISICIPTFNREKYLRECLQSITSQFKDKRIMSVVEVIISDNASRDGTKQLVNKYKKNFKNIFYYRNQKNIGGIKNSIKAANHACGNYIWFFSDDDMQKTGALANVLQVIKVHQPDAVYMNLDLVSKKANLMIDPNLFRAKKDLIISNKKALFEELTHKFMLPIDWYLTCLSSTIVKRTVFVNEKTQLFLLDSNKNIFPHASIIYYSSKNYKIYFVARRFILFRGDNRSFGSRDQIKFLTSWYRALNNHYGKILETNSQYMSTKFKVLLTAKVLIRKLRLFFLQSCKVDISSFLMKIFYR